MREFLVGGAVEAKSSAIQKRLRFHPDVTLSTDRKQIYKKVPIDKDPGERLAYYNQLLACGVPLGPQPHFIQDPQTKEITEVSDLVAERDDADMLLHVGPAEAVAYYRSTLLRSIHKIVAYQGGEKKSPLDFSIDPMPYNFVKGQYIDYEPITLAEKGPDNNKLTSFQLWNNALVKTAKIRPDLFEQFYQDTLAFLSENGYPESVDYFKNRPYEKVFALLRSADWTNESSKEKMYLDMIQYFRTIDVHHHKDDVLGMLEIVASFMNLDQQTIVAHAMGLTVEYPLLTHLVEEIHGQQNQNPAGLRKKVDQTLAVLVHPERYRNLSVTEHREDLEKTDAKVIYAAESTNLPGIIFNIGSLARDKVNIFSDLDYAYFTKGDIAKTVAFLNVLGVNLAPSEAEDLQKLQSGELEKIKIRALVDGMRISFQIYGQGCEEKIVSRNETVMRSYKSSTRIIKDVAGEKYITKADNDHKEYVRVLMHGKPVLGIAISNLLPSQVTYNNAEGSLLIDKLFMNIAQDIQELTGLARPDFDYFLRCLFYNKETQYSPEALEKLNKRWNSALDACAPQYSFQSLQ